MKDHFRELLEYSHHFNLKLIDIFNDKDTAEKLSGKSFSLMSHLLNAQHVWNSRIEQKEPKFGIWQMHEPEEFRSLEEQNYSESLQILQNFDLEKMISYQNSKGREFSNSVKDILFHVVNHSTYHRGQIASEFRKSAVEPVVSDYIFYKR
ncbi:MAG: DinB family protein [Salegentibacter sp.]